VYSEECSDEESAFAFPFLVTRIGKADASRLYPELAEGFSMTLEQSLNTPKDSVCLDALCALA
jgi:hypothetical protein